jgi:putative tryptophan/tyrosine transport system substrate-binding protein
MPSGFQARTCSTETVASPPRALLSHDPQRRGSKAARCLSAGPRAAPYWVAVFDGLRRAGFVEGQNLTIDWHQYGSRVDLIPEFAAELVKVKLDIIAATGDTAIRAVQHATTTIPILGSTDDMLGSGIVNSLARPDGNITGTSLFSTELDGKRQEILIEALPGLRHMAALADSTTTTAPRLRSLQDAARARGIELSVHQISKPDEIPTALQAVKVSGAAAINVLSSPVLYCNRHIIIQHAATLRLPAIYQFPEEAKDGDRRTRLNLAVKDAAFEACGQDVAEHDESILVRAFRNTI